MNILITSIGQRGYLIKHFKENNPEVNVYAADATEYAPGLQDADKGFVVPLAKDPKYLEAMLNICKKYDVNGIVSINDLELPILAKYADVFRDNGIYPVISDEEVVDICFDKYKTYLFCTKNGIGVPRTFLYNEVEKIVEALDNGEINFPIIAKPRKGSRSVGIQLVENIDQLNQIVTTMHESNLPEDEKLMFQEYIDSDQYSVHVFNNEKKEPIKVVGMINIFKHFGETFHIKTYKDDNLLELGRKIGSELGHLGPLSADVHKRKDGEYVVLEFNPRISGCYSLSHYAGADFTGKIIDLVKGSSTAIKDELFEFEDDIIMLKQFTTRRVTKSDIDKIIK